MKKPDIPLLLSMGVALLLASPAGSSDLLIWTDRGCDEPYLVGDPVTVYSAPPDGEKFELWAFDAVMNETLLSEGVSDGQTYAVTITAEPPLGPLTFVLKMECPGECQYCEMCDYGQCTIFVKDPCEDHCTNKIQDCRETGVDCGGGCPFKDADSDGVEDCRDLCPDSRCTMVDADGCETDGRTACEDDCPDERGDTASGCPSNSTMLLLGSIIGGAAIGGGLAVWKVRSKTPARDN
jgi:hypothetical protein